MRELMRVARNPKQLEHEAFYHGSQGCEPHDALAEIESHFNQKVQQAAHKATPAIKGLEAKLEDAKRTLPDAKTRFDSIVARHEGRLPEIFVPAFMVIIGFFAMLAESAMLAPFMDLFDITSPVPQHIAALAIGSACAIILHLAIESLTPQRFHKSHERLFQALGVCCVIGLIWAGIARGRQAAYGASLSGSPLAGFIHENPVLAILVYTFFTVAFPVAGALAITFGVKAAREWREFLISKREVKRLNNILATTPKEIENQQQRLFHEVNTIDQTKKEWQRAYMVQHQRGTAMGAAQTPKWMVYLKAGAVALLTLLVTSPLLAFPVVPIVSTLAAFTGSWVYFRHNWAHPKPEQLYRQQNVKFRTPEQTPTVEFNDQKALEGPR
jgi:hypothetical protein